MKRRRFLQLSFGSAAALFAPALHAQTLREIRIGYQKNGVLVIARQRATLEQHFLPQNIAIKWVEFSSADA